MHEDGGSVVLSAPQMISRMGIMIGVGLLVGFGTGFLGLDTRQAASCAVFISIIMGTLFFWNFRLAIAFLGLAVLIFTNSLTIDAFIVASELNVILFLVGMMVVVGALRDLGFFTWVVQLIVSMRNLTGKKFIAVTAVSSALLACAVDEVTSIIFISTLIFQVCDRLKLNPTPYIIICVFATNVGSAGTMMGNPVGILIGSKAGLSFFDFIIWAFPVMLIALGLVVAMTMWFYRHDLEKFDASMKERLSRNLSLVPKIDVPYKRGLILLVVTIMLIASHSFLESLFHLEKNSILMIAPLICSGVVMILRRDRARYYIEREVDWWTLLFFMLLFAVAGTLEYTHVDKIMANEFSAICGTNPVTLIPLILTVSAIGSAFVDNVIFVAAFCPVISKLAVSLNDLPLWWALLFGACFGGNITMIGSTANIVALGMLEKRSHVHMSFMQWLKIGVVTTLVTGGFACLALYALAPLMPDRYSRIAYADFDENTIPIANKNVIINAIHSDAGPDLSHAPKGYSAVTLQMTDGGRPPIRFTAYLPDPAMLTKIENTDGQLYYKGKLWHTATGAEYPAYMVVEEVLDKPPRH